MNRLSLFFLLIIVGVAVSHAQPIDSTLLHRAPPPVRDTVAVRDTSAAQDSVGVRFIGGMGWVAHTPDTLDVLNRDQFIWTDAAYTKDLMWKIPGISILETGAPGPTPFLFVDGLDMRNMTVLVDGRPMNDPVTGRYNLFHLPLEFVDQIETLDGPEALLGAPSASSRSLNFATRWFSSPRPITKIRYVEDPKETLVMDGLFTQNILRGTNLMIGFERSTSDGRYFNTSLDSWNLRVRLRADISDRINLALAHLYVKSTSGMNGGVNPAAQFDPFGGGSALVNDVSSYELLTRRDITFSAIARFLGDSASTTEGHAYTTSLEREYTTPNVRSARYSVSVAGVRAEQRVRLSFVDARLGAEVERRRTDRTPMMPAVNERRTSFFLNAEADAFPFLVPSVTLRQDEMRGKSPLSASARLAFHPVGDLELSVSVASLVRFPTMQEQYSTDSTLIRTGVLPYESHAIREVGLRWIHDPVVNVRASAFDRTIRDAVFWTSASTTFGFPAARVTSVPEIRTQGASVSVRFALHPFELTGTVSALRLSRTDTLQPLLPEWTGACELAHRNDFFDGAFEERTGVRVRFNSDAPALTMIAEPLALVPDPRFILGRNAIVDLFAVVRVGDAHLSLSLDNVFNANYLTLGYYPMPPRSVRLGVHWIFLD